MPGNCGVGKWTFLATKPHSMQGHSAVDSKDRAASTPSIVSVQSEVSALLSASRFTSQGVFVDANWLCGVLFVTGSL